MAWEKRRRGGRYFTRSIRVGGRVKRIYCGTGEAAAAALAELVKEQEARRRWRERRKASLAVIAQAVRLQRDYERLVKQAGLDYRRRAGARPVEDQEVTMAEKKYEFPLPEGCSRTCPADLPEDEAEEGIPNPELPHGSDGPPLEGEAARVRATKVAYELAAEGDKRVLPALREGLKHFPELVKVVGDMGALVANAWLDAAFGKNEAQKECVRLRLEALRGELERPGAGAFERLLVQRVVGSWLALQVAEGKGAEMAVESIRLGSGYVKAISQWGQRAQQAHLEALRALREFQRSEPATTAPPTATPKRRPRKGVLPEPLESRMRQQAEPAFASSN